jgi:integrase/recombinase XerD
MSTAPLITIFVRHSADCKYIGDEFCKRCRCRKHFRWTQNGKQYRRKAGTRSWEEAEEQKKILQDQLAGRTPRVEISGKLLIEAIDLFTQSKKNKNVTKKVLDKYTRELARLRAFCESRGVLTVQALTGDLLTEYCGTWPELYPSTTTRSKVRERCRSFLRYCYQVRWLDRVLPLDTIQVDEPETMPLTEAEYATLLDSVYVAFENKQTQERVHALIQLMRWSGLAIRDALTLKRSGLIHDAEKKVYRVVTSRHKTGTHVSVPIPEVVAKELLAALNGNADYIFWSGNGEAESATKNWAKYYIAPLFAAARIECAGHMMSHRLRDTFAVDLLQKGVPLEDVSKALGHMSIKTTEKSYAKWVKGRQDRLDSLVMGTWSLQDSSQ